jgi:hypothetical protein
MEPGIESQEKNMRRYGMKKVVSLLLSVALLLALAVVAPKAVMAQYATAYSYENAPFIYVASESSLSHVTLGWTPREGAAGYQVYMKQEKAAKYQKLATVKKITYVTKSLDSGSYSFKVRAYAKKNGKTVYGPFSSARTVEVSSLSYGTFGLGLLQSEDKLSELMTMVGGMKKVSSASYPTFAAKGNGISIGYNGSARYPNPYFMIRVKGNLGFWFGGIHCGYDRATALAVSGDELYSDDNGKTFKFGEGVYAGIKVVPTYDKNDVITEMLLTISPSG